MVSGYYTAIVPAFAGTTRLVGTIGYSLQRSASSYDDVFHFKSSIAGLLSSHSVAPVSAESGRNGLRNLYIEVNMKMDNTGVKCIIMRQTDR